MNKIIEAIASLIGDDRLPKSFRKTLEQYGDASISRIEVVREPLSHLAEGMMTLITAGKWEEIRKNFDKIYHLYAILYTDKGKLLLEKNQTPVLWPKLPHRGKEAESINIMTNGIKVATLIQTTIKKVGLASYVNYDAFRNNCQVFIKNHLLYNGLWEPQAEGFILQDTKKMVENTPKFSKWVGKAITDIAGKADTAIQELIYRKGGKVKKRRIGL